MNEAQVNFVFRSDIHPRVSYNAYTNIPLVYLYHLLLPRLVTFSGCLGTVGIKMI